MMLLKILLMFNWLKKVIILIQTKKILKKIDEKIRDT